MTAQLVYEHGVAQIAAPSANIPSGQIINHAVLGACIKEGLNATHDSGAPINVRYAGIARVASASGTTLAAGVIVEIVTATQLAVAESGGNFAIGRCVVAKTSGQTTVLVELNVAGT